MVYYGVLRFVAYGHYLPSGTPHRQVVTHAITDIRPCIYSSPHVRTLQSKLAIQRSLCSVTHGDTILVPTMRFGGKKKTTTLRTRQLVMSVVGGVCTDYLTRIRRQNFQQTANYSTSNN